MLVIDCVIKTPKIAINSLVKPVKTSFLPRTLRMAKIKTTYLLSMTGRKDCRLDYNIMYTYYIYYAGLVLKLFIIDLNFKETDRGDFSAISHKTIFFSHSKISF